MPARRSTRIRRFSDAPFPDAVFAPRGAICAGLKALVEDLNIKRKAVYAEQAQVQHATLEEYAFTAGCLAIARTVPGEKYQAPDGAWHTRSAGTPDRDARCP